MPDKTCVRCSCALPNAYGNTKYCEPCRKRIRNQAKKLSEKRIRLLPDNHPQRIKQIERERRQWKRYLEKNRDRVRLISKKCMAKLRSDPAYAEKDRERTRERMRKARAENPMYGR